MRAEDIHQALYLWFADGHSRFTMILDGSRRGEVLIAHGKEEAAPEIFARRVQSDEHRRVVSRLESPFSAADLAADPLNGPALIRAVEARLAGEIAPPPICSMDRPAPPARRIAPKP